MIELINAIIPFAITLTVLAVPVCIIVGMSFWSTANKSLASMPEKSARTKKIAKNWMMAPVVALVILIVMWGLVNIIHTAFAL